MINGHSASWQGAAGYVVYDWTPSVELATRAEFFDDMDGARTNGEAQTLWEITQTLSYKVPEVTGLIARLEYRHDNSSENSFTNNNFVNPVTLPAASVAWAGYVGGQLHLRLLTRGGAREPIAQRCAKAAGPNKRTRRFSFCVSMRSQPQHDA